MQENRREKTQCKWKCEVGYFGKSSPVLRVKNLTLDTVDVISTMSLNELPQ